MWKVTMPDQTKPDTGNRPPDRIRMSLIIMARMADVGNVQNQTGRVAY
jgi:hypothetical protein